MGVIRLGCSGWNYRDWAGVFYKDKEESKLRAYSRIFNTAEINSTFYGYPRPGIVFGWAKYTPQDFKFTVKLNRLITHEKMIEISKGVEDDLKDVYGYFNNHYYGYAPENCIDILEMLGMATPEQKEMRQHISGYWKGRVTTRVIAKTLGDYLAQEKKGIATLLSECMESSRLEKAREIKDIEIMELGTDKIVADVRGYSVYIDLEKRFILHDCADWQRTARERRFCKHIGALMLALPEDTARSVLERIRMQQWEFSQYTGGGEIYKLNR